MLEQVLLAAKARFDEQKRKAINGEYFKVDDAKDFCNLVFTKAFGENGTIEDYPCCEDYKFWTLYLTYYQNLAGGINYYKLDATKINQKIKTLEDIKAYDRGAYQVKVPQSEVEQDLSYLYNTADSWETVIRKRNHNDELLIEKAREVVKELKGFEKSNKKNPYFLGGFKYIKEKRGILLRSKYMYLTVKDIIEQTKKDDFILNLLGEKIYITAYSLIHIISGHYAKVTRQYYIEKTYHNEDIDPKTFHHLLNDIFSIINSSFITDKVNMGSIMIGINNHVYMIYTSVERRFVKGKGEVSYRRLNTFYPVSAQFVSVEIERGTIVYQLRTNVFFYCRPTN